MALCSAFALLCLHLFMYGCNLFMWKSTRINYNFIFEFSPNTALKYRDAFLLCTTCMTAVLGAMVVHLLLRASGFSPSQVDAIPGILLLVSAIVYLSTTILYIQNFEWTISQSFALMFRFHVAWSYVHLTSSTAQHAFASFELCVT